MRLSTPNRSALPNFHVGSFFVFELDCLPTEPRSEYADGPGDDTPAVDSFACSWPWKTFAACSRDDEPKPKEGAEPRELSGCEPNIERVPIFEAEAVLMMELRSAVAKRQRAKRDERGDARRTTLRL